MAKVNKFIDLHFHLDGSITPEIAKKLAKLQQIPLNFKSEQELINAIRVPEECNSLNDFLKCFEFPLSLLQTSIGIEEAVYLVLEEAKKSGVIYAEVRFAPQLHLNKGLTQEEVIKSALKGLKKASIKANLILCLMRGDNNYQENLLTVELAHKYLVNDGGVVALDLAGAETLYPTIDFQSLFALAKKYNIPFTIHAGEVEEPKSIIHALSFGAKRIGHGIRLLENEEATTLAKSSDAYFEMCPTSNFLTKAISSYKEFPIKAFINKGLKITINTDDLAIEGTSIDKEFELLEREFEITKEDEIKFLLNSIECAFTTDEVKKYLRKEILDQ